MYCAHYQFTICQLRFFLNTLYTHLVCQLTQKEAILEQELRVRVLPVADESFLISKNESKVKRRAKAEGLLPR